MPKQPVSTKDFENTIQKIKDVVASRVVLDEKGGIEEVHVLAGSGRLPKYIVRDVGSAIVAAFGVQVDRRKISVAQVNEDEIEKDRGRPRLVKVTLSATAFEAEASVELSLGGVSERGLAKGVPTPNRWLWLSAEATIAALSRFLPPKVKITLNDVCIAMSKSVRVALVTLSLLEETQEHMLSGSCPITYDDREAVVKATLDAINRRFSALIE